eukprot:CAMPEP_0196652576 /NCGR_PEP_ID=MMETSP1086-20130531/1918_1 /TAXON_ID=77921 /ORGANISM="Cyanoptyche  gloeocystis , Strain SAG4.97" /LENGTH=541 /DNA_ID=CAMNT_0041983205 /DNA_START=13 /DNA_END=1638 /DNA_ORIENTATION=-
MTFYEEGYPEREYPAREREYAPYRSESATDYNENSTAQSDGFDEQYTRRHYVPDVIKQFVQDFYRHIGDRNLPEILSIYENSFNKLTEQFYNNQPWPPAESISHLVDGDPVFLMLYRELYFRHIYAKLQPTIEHRFQSWDNYYQLMELLISRPSVDFELPSQWLWDMIDEYIYQFQSFCQYRAKLKQKTDEEVQYLRENSQVWNIHDVLQTLHNLIAKSDIVRTLEKERQSGEDRRHGQDGPGNMYRMLGYFSLIGLLRIHCLLGDYHLALKSVEHIDLKNKALQTSVAACHVTFYYYLAFAYLMMRRYVDCVRNLQHVILYVGRTKQSIDRSSYQYDQVMKKSEQMYAMLAMAVSLCPQRVDDSIQSVLRDKHADKVARLQKGEEESFKELFLFCCPKFIVPSSPDFDQDGPYVQEALVQQQKMFMTEVRQQLMLPTIRSYLKLYTTIPISSLVALLQEDESTFRTQLLCLKHKSRQLVWQSGPPLDGVWTSCSDVDFFLDRDMVHISDTRVTRRYGDFFVSHINKFDDLFADVLNLPNR